MRPPYRIGGPPSCRDIGDLVLHDIPFSWFPVHIQTADGGINNSQILYSTERLWELKKVQHLT